jgi:1,4-dihydroxy-2-naphthoate octaprenyltransferase
MPVFCFALSFVEPINWPQSILVFVLIHALLYPASNGYNSYMDRDTESIGGIKNPLQPTKQLFYTTLVLDILGTLLCLFISWQFCGL